MATALDAIPLADDSPRRACTYLGLPAYDGARWNTSAVLHASQCGHRVLAAERADSLLALNVNTLWADALNARAEGVTHFCLLHADVIPESPHWLAELHAIMARVEASVLSVVLPIKDERGLTSTARESRGAWGAERYTMQELEGMPATFTAPDLLLNTGLLLVDFREPWVERAHFAMRDAIVRDADGHFHAACQPEDWYFSRLVRQLGARLWATSEVRATHRGWHAYPNYGAWGTWERDRGDRRIALEALHLVARDTAQPELGRALAVDTQALLEADAAPCRAARSPDEWRAAFEAMHASPLHRIPGRPPVTLDTLDELARRVDGATDER